MEAPAEPETGSGTSPSARQRRHGAAQVRDAGDFFVAATDTSAGWSGGAAYDADLVLTGFLSRGALDLIDSPEGCRVAVHAPADAPVEEQFTYGARAVQALCEKEPSRAICAADCGHICQAPAEPETPAEPGHGLAADGGCSFTPCTGNRQLAALALILVGMVLSRRASGAHAPKRARSTAPYDSR